jgi:hypothetical protein
MTTQGANSRKIRTPRGRWAVGLAPEPCEPFDQSIADAARDHLAYNQATERHETGGDEIEFADEGD